MLNKLIASPVMDHQQAQIDDLIAEMKEILSYTWISTDSGIKAIKPKKEKNTLLARIHARLFSR